VKNRIAMELQVQSAAFRQAQLKSDLFRILVVVVAVLAILALHTIRMITLHVHEDRAHLLAKVIFVAFFVLYEMIMLYTVKHVLQAGRMLPSYAWIGDIIIETSLPALGIALLTSSVIAPAYRPIANPLALTFFLFIILSVLRLNPWASVLSGCVAAASYLCASYYLGWRPLLYTHPSIQSPERAVFSYALEFLVGGGVAGAVAREVRSHVNAALREAETRRQMERLEHDMKVARSISSRYCRAMRPQ